MEFVKTVFRSLKVAPLVLVHAPVQFT